MSTKHLPNPLLNSMHTLIDILAKYQTLPPERWYSLIDAAADAVKKHKVEQNITDWPFEFFWQNPVEPHHSKLLAYFIDPKSEHNCDKYLLGKLFETLNKSLKKINLRDLPRDDWVVVCESARIDILLTHKSKEGKYAIIIENKVNGAPDQRRQLETYFNKVRDNHKIKDENIYVLYLPLTGHKQPSPDSRGSIPPDQVQVITFKDHILPWLNAVLIADDKRDPELPKGIRNNLEHYRDLIIYLLNKQKGQQVNAEILEHLEKSAKEGEPLPTWSQVDKLTTSARALQECVECATRGKLLFSIQDQLTKQNISADFYMNDGKKIQPLSPYDKLFEATEINLGIAITDAITVCIGVNTLDGTPKTNFVFVGYMRKGRNKGQPQIKEEIKKTLQGTEWVFDDRRWYAFRWNKKINYENALEADIVKRLADQLITMRN